MKHIKRKKGTVGDEGQKWQKDRNEEEEKGVGGSVQGVGRRGGGEEGGKGGKEREAGGGKLGRREGSVRRSIEGEKRKRRRKRKRTLSEPVGSHSLTLSLKATPPLASRGRWKLSRFNWQMEKRGGGKKKRHVSKFKQQIDVCA